MDGQTYTYRAETDMDAMKKVWRNQQTSRPFLLWYMDWEINLIIFLGISFAIGTLGKSDLETLARVIASGATLAAAFLLNLSYQQLLKCPNLSWDCKISDESYSFTDTNGIGSIIPWRLMKVKLEITDAWLIEYGDQRSVIIFRKPLRTAGLEDEFRKRIPEPGDTTAKT